MNWLTEGIVVYAYIFFFLFIPGLLIQLNFLLCTRQGKPVLNYGELLLGGFIISLLLNGVIAGVVSFGGIGLDGVGYLLLSLTVVLIFFLFFHRTKLSCLKLLVSFPASGFDKLLFAFIVLMFFLMANQGGVLDMMADGWWHMAYANRMVQENSILVQHHPLVGSYFSEGRVFYPPLWHIQLALIQLNSGLPLPVIWHFIAAVNVSLLLLAFYLFTSRLSGSKPIALFATVLSVFLIGGLNTYFRVASWPGNTAYVFLFFAFYQTFKVLDELRMQKSRHFVTLLFRTNKKSILLLFLATIGLLTLHGVELVLFVLAIGVYFCAVMFIDLKNRERYYVVDRIFLGYLFLICFVVGTVAAFYLLPNHIEHVFSSPRAKAPYLNFIIPGFSVILGLAGVCVLRKNKLVWSTLFIAFVIAFVVFAIDLGQIKSLFFPESVGRHVPQDFFDQFHNRVYLPFWDHQLRGAFLYTGVVSVILGMLLPFMNNNRLNVFIGANAFFVLFVLTSPYFFTFISFLIPLPSVYRIHMLLFSPVVIVAFLWELKQHRWFRGG
jgi:hypothetical protein